MEDSKPRKPGRRGRSQGGRGAGQSGRGQGGRSQGQGGRGAERSQGGRGQGGRGRDSGQGRGRGQQGQRRRPQGQRRGGEDRAFKQQAIPLPTTYDVLFYKSIREAEAHQADIRAKAHLVDQMNVVLEAEDLIEDYSFADAAELYCGAAWTLIHRRRVEDGWYSERSGKSESTAEEPQEPQPDKGQEEPSEPSPSED